MRVFLYTSIILISLVNYHGDIWLSRWTAWQVLGSLLISYPIYRRYGLVASIAFFWPIWTAILVFDSQIPFTEGYGRQILTVENLTLRATVCWIISVLGVTSLSRKNQKELEKVFGYLCILNSCVVIFQALMGFEPDMRRGIIGTNASLNGCLIAVTIVFMEGHRNRWVNLALFLLPVEAIFSSGTSVPVGVLALMVLSYIRVDPKSSLALGASVLITGYFHTPRFLQDSGRFWTWQHSFLWWVKNTNVWIGTGNGTFFIIGPLVHNLYGSTSDMLFIWAHNDWLQTLIEQGIVGLSIFITLFLLVLYKSWNRKYLFAGSLGYGAISFFNFPAHSPLLAIVGILLAARSLDKEPL